MWEIQVERKRDLLIAELANLNESEKNRKAEEERLERQGKGESHKDIRPKESGEGRREGEEDSEETEEQQEESGGKDVAETKKELLSPERTREEIFEDIKKFSLDLLQAANKNPHWIPLAVEIVAHEWDFDSEEYAEAVPNWILALDDFAGIPKKEKIKEGEEGRREKKERYFRHNESSVTMTARNQGAKEQNEAFAP